MRKNVIGAVLAAGAVLSIGAVAGAQQGPPPGRGGFGHHGPEGRGGPGGFVGQRGCVPSATTPTCPTYQVTYTITSTEPVLLGSSPGTPNSITKVTTGTLAADQYGDTYREVNLSGAGGLMPQGGSGDFIYVRNLSNMMEYIVNVSKNTYEEFAIHQHTPPANWQGKGPNNGGGSSRRPTPTPGSYIIAGATPNQAYTCATENTSFSHNITIQLASGPTTATITSNRAYCPALKLVVSESHSDPRFGTRTYQLSGFTTTVTVSFTPPFNLSPAPTLVQKKNFGHGRGPRGGNS